MIRFLLVILFLLPLPLGLARGRPSAGTEILWDTWGVPHIFAASDEDAFYAYGWAQARHHGERIVQLYAQARGRAAEHYGAVHLDGDRAARFVRAPERAGAWYAAQSPEFRRNLDAFAAGFTAYAAAHGDEFSPEARSVLPVRATDVLGHVIRQLTAFTAAECAAALPGLHLGGAPGSNGWAIAPSRSESGNALLLANPHLGWGGSTLFFGAQIETPTYQGYGATLIGMPVPLIVFNDRLGWTHTTNTHDGCDLYRLELQGDGYRLDGSARPFETETQTIRVRQEDGTLLDVPLEVRRSVHGPVVSDDGTLAMRLVGVDVADYPGLLEQWWDMAPADDVAAFQAVLARHQLPSQNVIYADADGHTLLLFAGRVPVRNGGDGAFWRRPVPRDRSDLMWSEVHPFDELPLRVDPPDGWLQNSNSAPWFMTGADAPDPADFPAYPAPTGPVNLREQRGSALILADERMSLDDLVRSKHDTTSELARRVLDDLLEAADGEEGLSDAVRTLQLRPALRDRVEIENHLDERTVW